MSVLVELGLWCFEFSCELVLGVLFVYDDLFGWFWVGVLVCTFCFWCWVGLWCSYRFTCLLRDDLIAVVLGCLLYCFVLRVYWFYWFFCFLVVCYYFDL